MKSLMPAKSSASSLTAAASGAARPSGAPTPNDHVKSKDNPAYYRQHRAVVRKWGRAREYECMDCNDQTTPSKWSWTHGTDRWNPDNYLPRCHRCHMQYDYNFIAPYVTAANLGRALSLEHKAALRAAMPPERMAKLRAGHKAYFARLRGDTS
jgi:hypothetical protein